MAIQFEGSPPDDAESVTSAVRRDDDLAIRETAGFVGPPGGRVFTVRHEPLTAPMATCVMCPAILGDVPKNYRREVLTARTLAARGFLVERFHYRGTGNSEGDPAAVTLTTMLDDALAAAARARSAAPAARLATVGTRWGALVAATVAARTPVAPLALVEPVLEARAYFREAFRARAIARMRPDGERPGEQALLAELDERGFVDLIGHALHAALYHSAIDGSLLRELGGTPRPVLIVQLGGGEVRASHEHARSALAALDFDAQVAIVEGAEGWWLLEDVERYDAEEDAVGRRDAQVAEAVGAWVADRALAGREETV